MYTINHESGYEKEDFHLGWFLYHNGTPLFCTSVSRQTKNPTWNEDHSTTSYYPEGEITTKEYEVLSVVLTEKDK